MADENPKGASPRLVVDEEKLDKSLWPNFRGTNRVPGQVPRMTIPAELTKMPEPYSVERRLAHTDPVLRPEGVTEGLGLSPAVARQVQEEVAEALHHPELNFRANLFQKLHQLKLDGSIRQAIAQRARTYYRTSGHNQNKDATLARRLRGLRKAQADLQVAEHGEIGLEGGLSYHPEFAVDGQDFADAYTRLIPEGDKPVPQKAHVQTREFQKADARGGKYVARVKKPGGGYRYFYDEEKYSKRPDAHISGRSVLKAKCKGELCKKVGKGAKMADVIKQMQGGKYDDDLIKDAIRDAVKSGQLVHDNGKLKPRTEEK